MFLPVINNNHIGFMFMTKPGATYLDGISTPGIRNECD